MSSQTTNIGRDDQDKSYRYKMPKLQTKIEGRGNGIKTVIPNMSDIARSLHCDPGYPTKYFGIELGAQSKYDTKRDVAIVNGAHQTSDLVTHLNKFIDQFILCPKCRLPEINMEVKPKSGTIKVDCRACGFNAPLKTSHKLTIYILNNPPASKKGGAHDNKEFSDQQKASKSKDKGKGKDKADDASNGSGGSDNDEDESKEEPAPPVEPATVEWFTDTSAAAVEARKVAEIDSMRASAKVDAILSAGVAAGPESPVDLLRHQLAAGRSVSEVQAELRRLQLARGFNEQERVCILFEALVDPTHPVKANLVSLKNLAKHLVPVKANSMVLMGAVEQVVTDKVPGLAEKMDVIAQLLYNADVLTEEQIIGWYESPAEASPLSNKKQALDLRKNAKKFVDWLLTAEEESDDE